MSETSKSSSKTVVSFFFLSSASLFKRDAVKLSCYFNVFFLIVAIISMFLALYTID